MTREDRRERTVDLVLVGQNLLQVDRENGDILEISRINYLTPAGNQGNCSFSCTEIEFTEGQTIAVDPETGELKDYEVFCAPGNGEYYLRLI